MKIKVTIHRKCNYKSSYTNKVIFLNSGFKTTTVQWCVCRPSVYSFSLQLAGEKCLNPVAISCSRTGQLPVSDADYNLERCMKRESMIKKKDFDNTVIVLSVC